MDKRIFHEVRCNYFCEEENRWYIDAWTEDSDNDGNGMSVGYVDGISGNIYYKSEDAENDPLVREVAMTRQTEVRERKKKIWAVNIAEYKAKDNYLNSYTELYDDEKKARERVDEYSVKAIDQAPIHGGIDGGGELIGEYGYVTYFKNGDIAKVYYTDKEMK